jgi:hypothetical protein
MFGDPPRGLLLLLPPAGIDRELITRAEMPRTTTDSELGQGNRRDNEPMPLHDHR